MCRESNPRPFALNDFTLLTEKKVIVSITGPMSGRNKNTFPP